MDFITSYKIEDFAIKTKWKDFPEDVQERAVRCSIDLFGALILGSKGRQFQAGERFALMCGMNGDVSVVGSARRYNLLGASVVMGHAGNSFDIDDGFNLIKGHPGASFIAGVLAAAQYGHHTYCEFLTTLVVCYELGIRWGLAMQDHYQYLHSTGAYGAFGTAAGVGRLLGLNREQLNNALSIADYHAPMTPVMRAVEYPSMNKDGVPFGVLAGSAAVLETLCGETGKTHLLEMPKYRDFVDSLGEKYYIRDLYFKPYTCCRWAHQPIAACIDLKKKYLFPLEQIKKVRINTFEAAVKLSKKIPHDTDEAQYNISFPVASALVYGDVGLNQIRDEALSDDAVLHMMEKLEFAVDPSLNVQFPEKRLAWVEIELQSGEKIRSDVYEAPGEHTDSALNYDWIVRKFKRITSPVIGISEQNMILDFIGHVHDGKMADIVAAVNRAMGFGRKERTMDDGKM